MEFCQFVGQLRLNLLMDLMRGGVETKLMYRHRIFHLYEDWLLTHMKRIWLLGSYRKKGLPRPWAQGTDVLRAYGKLRVVHGAKVQFACSPHCPLLFWAAPRPSLQFPGLYLPARYTGLDLPGGALCILRKLYSSGHCSSYQATKMTTSGGEKFTRHINAISFLSRITWCYKLLKHKHNFRKSIKFFKIVSRSPPFSQQMRS